MTDHDVIIVGAGFGGMGAAISLKRLGFGSASRDIAILEREDDLGGTWHVNRYPGLAVDIASVTYSYSFEPNPHWRHWFARGPELKRYAEHVADTYDLRRHMEFGVRVEGARWDEEAQHWVVTTRGGTRTATYLMTATGFLSQPRLPDIAGVEDFAGTVIHTAKWDDTADLDGKRVAVIGTGATAVQLIPEIARRAAALTVFQRTPIWVTPKADFRIPRVVQTLFAAQPWTQRLARRANSTWLEAVMVTGVLHYRQAKLFNQGAAALAKAHLRRQVKDPDLRRKLTPDYSFGCKRPTFSNDYYPTFTRPHVSLETTPISRITETGVVTADGHETDVDVLVLATGFNLWDTNFPAIEVIGREGRNLGKHWREQGYHAFEFGMAPLAGLEDRPLAPIMSRVGNLLFERGEEIYNFQGVRRYKDKYDPLWQSRYVAAPHKWNLPLLLADAGLLSSGGMAGLAKRPKREEGKPKGNGASPPPVAEPSLP